MDPMITDTGFESPSAFANVVTQKTGLDVHITEVENRSNYVVWSIVTPTKFLMQHGALSRHGLLWKVASSTPAQFDLYQTHGVECSLKNGEVVQRTVLLEYPTNVTHESTDLA